jgi:hypothetical protein
VGLFSFLLTKPLLFFNFQAGLQHYDIVRNATNAIEVQVCVQFFLFKIFFQEFTEIKRELMAAPLLSLFSSPSSSSLSPPSMVNGFVDTVTQITHSLLGISPLPAAAPAPVPVSDAVPVPVPVPVAAPPKRLMHIHIRATASVPPPSQIPVDTRSKAKAKANKRAPEQ